MRGTTCTRRDGASLRPKTRQGCARAPQERAGRTRWHPKPPGGCAAVQGATTGPIPGGRVEKQGGAARPARFRAAPPCEVWNPRKSSQGFRLEDTAPAASCPREPGQAGQAPGVPPPTGGSYGSSGGTTYGMCSILAVRAWCPRDGGRTRGGGDVGVPASFCTLEMSAPASSSSPT